MTSVGTSVLAGARDVFSTEEVLISSFIGIFDADDRAAATEALQTWIDGRYFSREAKGSVDRHELRGVLTEVAADYYRRQRLGENASLCAFPAMLEQGLLNHAVHEQALSVAHQDMRSPKVPRAKLPDSEGAHLKEVTVMGMERNRRAIRMRIDWVFGDHAAEKAVELQTIFRGIFNIHSHTASRGTRYFIAPDPSSGLHFNLADFVVSIDRNEMAIELNDGSVPVFRAGRRIDCSPHAAREQGMMIEELYRALASRLLVAINRRFQGHAGAGSAAPRRIATKR